MYDPSRALDPRGHAGADVLHAGLRRLLQGGRPGRPAQQAHHLHRHRSVKIYSFICDQGSKAFSIILNLVIFCEVFF